MVSSRPVLSDRTERDPAQGVPGARMDDREVEVTDEQHEKDVHQSVVDEQRARETDARVAFAVPEQEAGDCEEDGERAADRGVQLLPGVEASLRRPRAPQPAAVVRVEAVELAQRAPEAGPVSEDRKSTRLNSS